MLLAADQAARLLQACYFSWKAAILIKVPCAFCLLLGCHEQCSPCVQISADTLLPVCCSTALSRFLAACLLQGCSLAARLFTSWEHALAAQCNV